MNRYRTQSTRYQRLARTLLSVELVAATVLIVATVALGGPRLEVEDDIAVSLLLVGFTATGLYQVETRGYLSELPKASGVLLGLWLIGTSFDFGVGTTLMLVGIGIGTCVLVSHLVLARISNAKRWEQPRNE